MKVTTETLPERQVRLEIEVDDDRHQEAMEQAYWKLAPSVRIPGFRPGKAPRTMIEKQLGHHRLLDEAMDILLPKVYREAIEGESLDPVANPAVELVSHEPLVFKATVPLMPIIELGDYQSIRVAKETISVTDEQVDESITELRRRYGTIEPVDRKAKDADVIRANVGAEVDGESVFSADEIEFRLTNEALSSLPGLHDVLLGLKKGDEVTKTADAPADFADEKLAGKTITYKINLHEVKEEKPAPLEDSFAKEVGEGFESLQALRDRIREDLEKAETEAAGHRHEHSAVDALVEKATIEYPSVLLEREIDHMLEEQARLDPRDPRAVELYLQRHGKSEAEVRESVREEAEQRLRRSLVLSQFAEAENIDVDESDIEQELDKMLVSVGDQADAIRRLFDNESSRDSLRRSLHTRKTLNRLVEIASADSADAAAAPVKKTRAARPKAAKAEATAEAEATSKPEKTRRSGPRKAD